MTAGYSGTPLVKKLGIKGSQAVVLLDPPEGYSATLGPLPPGTTLARALRKPAPFIHFFAKRRARLERQFPALKRALARDGMLWISWPKRASAISTDLDENVVREIGLRNGLVDIKVCAVDDDWSALKFVYRLNERNNV